MTTKDIMSNLVKIHNNLIQIPVSGEGALLMSDSIRAIRMLLQELEKDIQTENTN